MLCFGEWKKREKRQEISESPNRSHINKNCVCVKNGERQGREIEGKKHNCCVKHTLAHSINTVVVLLVDFNQSP